jgi:signal transduction histidine kinase
VVRSRRGFGLRPRLVIALLVSSAATLVITAFFLLGPLQKRLRDQSQRGLVATALAYVPDFKSAILKVVHEDAERHDPVEKRDNDVFQAVLEPAIALRKRTNARVMVTTAVPGPLFDTDNNAPFPQHEILRSLISGHTETERTAGQATVTIPIPAGRPDKVLYLLVVRKQFTDVADTVRQVRRAFLTAALIAIGFAAVLGLGIAATLTRRLKRLRASALRITAEGTEAPSPMDRTQDEVGDLARTLAAMQESLRRQEAARRAFVSTASHELRTPLTSLQGTLELLSEDLADGRIDLDDAQRQVATAQVELRRLGSLATELLELSRLDAAVPLRVEPVELSELCRAVAAEFELRAADQRVAIDVVEPPGPCWGRGDPGAVARIVRILIDNALRFSPAGRAVRVTAAYHGELATVEVADAGPGVPEDERERIFERFERGSLTGGEGGFGLGLAIGRELAQRQDGDLELADSGPGPGARFVLSLPIELPGGAAAQAAPSKPAEEPARR